MQFTRHGAYLALAARRDQLLDDLVVQCKAGGGRAVAIPTDVSEPEQVENLAQTTLDEFGRIDVWVNNAGAGAVGPFEAVPLEDHIQVIKTDLLGTLYGTRIMHTTNAPSAGPARLMPLLVE